MNDRTQNSRPIYLVGPAFGRRVDLRLFEDSAVPWTMFFNAGKPLLGRRELANLLATGGVLAGGPPPISREDLRDKVCTLFNGYLRSPDAVRPAQEFDDEVYYLPTRAEVEQVLRNRRIPYPNYTPTVFDCEDFAYGAKVEFALHRALDPSRGDYFTAFAAGLVWADNVPSAGSGGHAVNFVVTAGQPPGQELLLVDTTPGSRQVMTLPEAQALADQQRLPRMSIRAVVV